MGIINIKTNLQRVGYAEADKYITSTLRYSTISTDDLLSYASENSGIPKAQMMAAFYAINQQVTQFILNGHSLQLGTLGYFYLSAKTKASDTEKEAGVDAIEKVVVKFRQSKKLGTLISQNVKFLEVGGTAEEDVSENENSGTDSDNGNTDNSGSESNPL